MSFRSPSLGLLGEAMIAPLVKSKYTTKRIWQCERGDEGVVEL